MLAVLPVLFFTPRLPAWPASLCDPQPPKSLLPFKYSLPTPRSPPSIRLMPEICLLYLPALHSMKAPMGSQYHRRKSHHPRAWAKPRGRPLTCLISFDPRNNTIQGTGNISLCFRTGEWGKAACLKPPRADQTAQCCAPLPLLPPILSLLCPSHIMLFRLGGHTGACHQLVICLSN